MIDAHVHLYPGDTKPLFDKTAAFGANRVNVLGVPALLGADNNLRCLHLKRQAPGHVWAFCGLIWRGQTCPDPRAQLDTMLAAGFDGLKLLETKPTLQKELAFLPDDPAFAPLFALAQEKQVPILWHVGDPAPFWHADKAPQFAVDNGWTYEDPSFMRLEEIYERTERVLERYPHLHVIFAHLYFCSDDREHLVRLLERYPNLHIDITPGSEMYADFARDQAGWEAFFKTYAKRILLGTDTTNAEDPVWREMNGFTRGILKKERFMIWGVDMTGFDLTDAEYTAITQGNFMRLAGEEPREINQEGLSRLVAFYRQHLDPKDVANLESCYKELFS